MRLGIFAKTFPGADPQTVLRAAAGFDGDLVTHGLSAAEAPGVAAYLRGLTA